MAEIEETELSAEGVPLEAQDEAAAAQADDSVDAVVQISELTAAGNDYGSEEPLTVETAEEIGNIIADAVVAPDRLVSPAQDGLNYENARRDEAVAQGVEVTTQERLRELARQEEAQGQGVDAIWDTTQKKLFHESRAEEARAGKLEQAVHGPTEPLTITPHGVDQVALNEEAAKEREEQEEVVAP